MVFMLGDKGRSDATPIFHNGAILVFHSRPAEQNPLISLSKWIHMSGDAVFRSFWALSDISGRKKRSNRPRNGRDRSLKYSSLANISAHSVSQFAIYFFRKIFPAIIFYDFLKIPSFIKGRIRLLINYSINIHKT